MNQIKQLVNDVLKGNRRSIAKTITLIENNPTQAQKAVSQLYPHTGKAHIIGITGPTGSGKSTLIKRIAEELRTRQKRIGIIAVDPSSPFTGGAFLGDRIRMQKLSTDKEVFIRSMATRNSPGGLARATKDAVKVLDASGKDIIIVETVGAGQSEVDIIKIAHTIVVVLAPGLGDDIQAIKAGMMEIGDIFVVNKADREHADEAVIDIETILNMSSEKEKWKPPVIKTTAAKGEGTTELLNQINQHMKCLKKESFDTQLRQKAETELVEAIKQKTTDSIIDELRRKGELEKLVEKILAKETDPYSAADTLLEERLKGFKTHR